MGKIWEATDSHCYASSRTFTLSYYAEIRLTRQQGFTAGEGYKYNVFYPFTLDLPRLDLWRIVIIFKGFFCFLLRTPSCFCLSIGITRRYKKELLKITFFIHTSSSTHVSLQPIFSLQDRDSICFHASPPPTKTPIQIDFIFRKVYK